jgi:hypothetical protein
MRFSWCGAMSILVRFVTIVYPILDALHIGPAVASTILKWNGKLPASLGQMSCARGLVEWIWNTKGLEEIYRFCSVRFAAQRQKIRL